jgi:RHS repeat-associated protein
MGRITQVSKAVGTVTYSTQYGYNLAGEINKLIYPSGRIVTPGYDGLGRLSQVTDAANSYLTNMGYNSAQQPTGFNYGNGVVASFGYNDHLQLSTLKYSLNAGDLLNLTYNYQDAQGHNNGQIQGITDTRGAAFSTSYSYDGLGRLQQAQTNDLTAPGTWRRAWTYDRWGNRLTQTLTGGNMPNGVGQPQLTVDPATNHITGFGYDANGNLIHDGSSNGNTYTFDAENRMTKSVVGSTTTNYSYDGTNLRVLKGSTVYIYSGSKVIAEYASGASPTSPTKEYVYSGSKLLATLTGTTVTYHHADHLSNRVETNASGAVTRAFGQLPFGETWYENTGTDKWKFTTYERDSETGFDYAINRYYSSGYGRFMTADLLGGHIRNPQSLNRYGYVTNDPMNLVDPLGLSPFLLTTTYDCTIFSEGGKITSIDCEAINTTITDLGGSDGGGGGGGGGGSSSGSSGPRHDAFKDKYEKCRKDTFGNASVIPGTDTPVPGEEATLLILGAAYSEGVDNSELASFVATIGLESGYNLYPKNNANLRHGSLNSVDIGPGQVNLKESTIRAGNFDTDVFGTNVRPGQKFNGDPYQNLEEAADVFNSKKAPENYVGGGQRAQDRKNSLDELTPALQKFIDCLQK